MKQLALLRGRLPRQSALLRRFSTANNDDDFTFKIPNFGDSSNQSQQISGQNSQSNIRGDRMREQRTFTGGHSSHVKASNQQQPTGNSLLDQMQNEFDRKIEAKFGLPMVHKLNREANQRLNKTSPVQGLHPQPEGATQQSPQQQVNLNQNGQRAVTLQSYNSFETAENTWDVKRVINQVNDHKKMQYQKHRYSSFDVPVMNLGTVQSDKQQTNIQFYLNRARISEVLDTNLNEIVPIKNNWQDQDIIPTLENGLDVILKNPGIYPVESINHYMKGKLDTFFTRLPQYSQINEACISPYYPPGQDQNLLRIATENHCRYTMSTSTISSVLAHIYYCLSNFKSPHFNNLSEAYDREPLKFMISQRKPNTVFLTKIDKAKRIYSVDGDSGFIEPSNVVLLKMGKYMEKMLTTPHNFFQDHYILDPRTNKPKKEVKPGDVKQRPGPGYEEDYFRYMKSGNLMLRSQIDAQGIDAQGNSVVFELKTRATSVLRYEIYNYIDYLDYEIVKYKGKHSSYEREFYDLVRGGFLKYIMQCKIGRMDGALIAYHNTQKVFGFEYIKLADMEKRVFGCPEFSDVVFKSGLSIIEKIFDYILEDQDQLPSLPSTAESSGRNKIFKIGFYANEYERFLNVLVEVFDDDMFYQERFKNVLPEYMRDPIDYYVSHKIQPQVYKYVVGVYPVLNGQFVDHSPILFEPGDHLEVKHTIQRYGRIEFNEYMKFLHEAYKCDSINLDNEYAGTWSFVV